MLRDEEWCKIFVKVRGRGLNFEASAAILKPSCSQARPLESPGQPETDPSRVNKIRSGRWQGATKEYTLTVALRRCAVSAFDAFIHIHDKSEITSVTDLYRGDIYHFTQCI